MMLVYGAFKRIGYNRSIRLGLWRADMKLLTRFVADESGATAIEYGLIAALIAVAIITALRALSGNIQNTFNYVGTQLAGATTN
jgi:pilus assembly protein Flp/PilA